MSCGCGSCMFVEYGGGATGVDSTEMDHVGAEEPAGDGLTLDAVYISTPRVQHPAPAPLPDAGGKPWGYRREDHERLKDAETNTHAVPHPGAYETCPTCQHPPASFAPAPPAPEAPGEMSREEYEREIAYARNLLTDRWSAAVLAHDAALRASREAERQSAERWAKAADASTRERDEAREQRDAEIAARLATLDQLPDGMQHCTIVSRRCPVGHGWLTATNWADFPCPTCDLAAANARAEEAEELGEGLAHDLGKADNDRMTALVELDAERAARLKAEAEREAYKQDRDLCAMQRHNWEKSAAQFCTGMEYYRGIVIQIGELLGPEAKTCDDGSIAPDVLCAKVAEVAKARLERLAAAEAEVKRLTERVEEDNAVCLCGCPPDAHESLGEDGESCGHDDHECLRVAPAVATLFASLRARAQRLVEAGLEVKRAGAAIIASVGSGGPLSEIEWEGACEVFDAAAKADAHAKGEGR